MRQAIQSHASLVASRRLAVGGRGRGSAVRTRVRVGNLVSDIKSPALQPAMRDIHAIQETLQTIRDQLQRSGMRAARPGADGRQGHRPDPAADARCGSTWRPPFTHRRAPAGPSPEINAINTVWVLIAAFLVFCMQVGFVMLEAGFARSRESINILVEGIVDTCICGVTFWAWGFAFMFEPGNGFIGTTGFFLNGLPDTYGTTGVPLLAFWVFQFAFADTCSTITSGAMVGRCGFVGDILYSIGVTGFIYPIIGHWAWGPDGWLAVMAMPFRDFAGSTVVHSIGGAISLIGAIALGPRLGPRLQARRRRPAAAAQHHPRRGRRPDPLVRLVRLQPGQHAVGDGHAGHRAACRSTRRWRRARPAWRRSSTPTRASRSGTSASPSNGFLAGLVAITAPCYWVSPTGAFFIGIVAGVLVMLGDRRCSSTCASTIRLARCRCIWAAASGARCRSACSRPARTGCRRRPASTRRVSRQGPVLRRRHGTADGAGDRQRARSSSRRWRRRSC